MDNLSLDQSGSLFPAGPWHQNPNIAFAIPIALLAPLVSLSVGVIFSKPNAHSPGELE